VVLFGGANGDFTLTSGIVNLNGFSLTIEDTLRLEAGTTLNLEGGSYTAVTTQNLGTINP